MRLLRRARCIGLRRARRSDFDPGVVEPVVEQLADLAAGGRALEFAIGTGRIALPLSERGVRIAGIDNSEAMVARLRVKPGAEHIEVTIGDFATSRLEGEFSLVYLVFNTTIRSSSAGHAYRNSTGNASTWPSLKT
jgi:SAM-dependent methyltransferase